MLNRLTFITCSIIGIIAAIISFIIGLDSYLNNEDIGAAIVFICLGLFGTTIVNWLTFLVCSDIPDNEKDN